MHIFARSIYNAAMSKPQHAPAMDRLVEQLSKLPGIGRRSAQRVAFHLLRQPSEEVRELADAIRQFTENLHICRECGYVSEDDPCPICKDDKRDGKTILVVEQPTDVATFEALGTFKGKYHVLLGRLAPLEGVGAGELNVDRLLDRVKKEKTEEVILGTNPTFEGDGTAMYLAQKLEELGVRVTRLARGLPTGSSLDTLSKAVLADAIHGRRSMPR